jgi:hypothetical protein
LCQVYYIAFDAVKTSFLPFLRMHFSGIGERIAAAPLLRPLEDSAGPRSKAITLAPRRRASAVFNRLTAVTPSLTPQEFSKQIERQCHSERIDPQICATADHQRRISWLQGDSSLNSHRYGLHGAHPLRMTSLH